MWVALQSRGWPWHPSASGNSTVEMTALQRILAIAGTLKGLIYLDNNENGRYECGEPGVIGIGMDVLEDFDDSIFFRIGRTSMASWESIMN